jgi:hypothetical protein
MPARGGYTGLSGEGRIPLEVEGFSKSARHSSDKGDPCPTQGADIKKVRHALDSGSLEQSDRVDIDRQLDPSRPALSVLVEQRPTHAM